MAEDGSSMDEPSEGRLLAEKWSNTPSWFSGFKLN